MSDRTLSIDLVDSRYIEASYDPHRNTVILDRKVKEEYPDVFQHQLEHELTHAKNRSVLEDIALDIKSDYWLNFSNSELAEKIWDCYSNLDEGADWKEYGKTVLLGIVRWVVSTPAYVFGWIWRKVREKL